MEVLEKFRAFASTVHGKIMAGERGYANIVFGNDLVHFLSEHSDSFVAQISAKLMIDGQSPLNIDFVPEVGGIIPPESFPYSIFWEFDVAEPTLLITDRQGKPLCCSWDAPLTGYLYVKAQVQPLEAGKFVHVLSGFGVPAFDETVSYSIFTHKQREEQRCRAMLAQLQTLAEGGQPNAPEKGK